MITFMHCKAVPSSYDQCGLGLESVVGLGLACGFVLRLGLVSGLYKWLFYLATVRQLNHFVLSRPNTGLNNLSTFHHEPGQVILSYPLDL